MYYSDTLESMMSIKEGIDEAMAILQERSLANELDYQFVMDCPKKNDLKNPSLKTWVFLVLDKPYFDDNDNPMLPSVFKDFLQI